MSATRSLRVRGAARSLGLMLRRRLLRWILAGRSQHRHPRFAVLAGDLVSEEILVAGLYEEALLRTLFETLLAPRKAAFADGVALDVGANIGNHALFFARRFRAVVAFEPNPVALALLRCNVALAEGVSVRVVPVGLGDREGRFAFVQDASGNLGGSGFRAAGVAGARSIECEVRRGDDVLAAEALPGPVRLVKLDIEGGELAALGGLRRTLVDGRPVVLFESNRAGGPAGGEAIVAFLRSLGYARFWAVEERGHAAGRWARLASRLTVGEVIEVRPIERLEDRPYSMLVAEPSAAPDAADFGGESPGSRGA